MYNLLPRVVFLNGPAQVGKDTLANLLCQDKRFRHMKMSKKLKDALRPFLPDPLVNFDLAAVKESMIGRHTVRQALISLSEEWAKPMFGEDVFGRLLADDMERLLEHNPSIKFVISDSRFAGECEPVLKLCGKGLVVHIHREGYGFAGDSGSYISLDIPTVRLDNNGTKENMLSSLEDKLIGW